MLKTKIDVLFLFEKHARELDALCLLKLLLEREGYSVAIVQQNTQTHAALRNYKPSIVVLPFCYQNRSNNIFFKFWRTSVFVSLNWEQFFYPGNQIAKSPRGIFATKHVIHCAWSQKYCDLLTNCGVPKENIRIIGSLPLSLLDLQFSEYYLSKEEIAGRYELNVKKKWIFFPENFGWAFYKKEMLDQMVNDGQSLTDVVAMREFSEKSFREIIDWCIKLTDAHDLELILRPRPATTADEIKTKIKDLFGFVTDKIKIIKDLSVKDWINASDYVVSSYSTTLIESAVAQKNIAMLTPYPILDILKQEWHPYVEKCETFDQFESCVIGVRNVNYNRLGNWAIGNLHLQSEPVKRVVELIKDIKQRNVLIPEKPDLKYLMINGVGIIDYVRYGLGYIKTYLKLQYLPNVSPSQDSEYYEDYLSVKDIDIKCARWNKVLALKKATG